MNYKYSYERTGNDCWLVDTLELTKFRLIHTVQSNGWSEANEVKVLTNNSYSKEEWISNVLKYLATKNLSVTNFIGLSTVIKDYLD
jgi:hypothetical protein